MSTRSIFWGIVALVVMILVSIWICMRINNQGLTESIEFAEGVALRNASLPARYASYTLQTVELEQTDCFVCSIACFPPLEAIKQAEGEEELLFPNYIMQAYVVSGSPIHEDSITLSISVYNKDMEAFEEFPIEAEIISTTDNLCVAEFLFPRNKLPVGLLARLRIRCGTGDSYDYAVLVDHPQCIHPNIFMLDYAEPLFREKGSRWGNWCIE